MFGFGRSQQAMQQTWHDQPYRVFKASINPGHITREFQTPFELREFEASKTRSVTQVRYIEGLPIEEALFNALYETITADELESFLKASQAMTKEQAIAATIAARHWGWSLKKIKAGKLTDKVWCDEEAINGQRIELLKSGYYGKLTDTQIDRVILDSVRFPEDFGTDEIAGIKALYRVSPS